MDLISRQAAIEELREMAIALYGYDSTSVISCAIYKLQNLQSAERRGRWEEVQRLSPAEHQAICKCSVCGDTVWAYIGKRRWHYCPNYGSRMDLDEVERNEN